MRTSFVIAGIVFVMLTGCKKDSPAQAELVVPPTVTTASPSEIGDTGFKTGGTITSSGRGTISASGIVFGTSAAPTLGSTVAQAAPVNGVFVVSLTQLAPATRYYVRAFATNKAGTSYGNEIEVTTTTPPEPVTDIDGNTYQTVRIGTKIWMKENLRTTRYADGTTISGHFAYDNQESNAAVFGRLYQWNAASQNAAVTNAAPSGIQGACPAGYHLPSEPEWLTLFDFLGGESVAGGKMKATGTRQAGTGLWDEPNTAATNVSGFSGLPGGYRIAEDGSFTVKNRTGTWWSTSRSGSFHRVIFLGHETANVAVFGWSTPLEYSDAFAIRCVKN